MTIEEFEAVCGECLIAPQIAVESEAVKNALKNNATYEEVKKILEEEF